MRFCFWGDENVLKLVSGDACKTCEFSIKKANKLYTLNGELYGMWIIPQ